MWRCVGSIEPVLMAFVVGLFVGLVNGQGSLWLNRSVWGCLDVSREYSTLVAAACWWAVGFVLASR